MKLSSTTGCNHRIPAFSILFARYIAGQIGDTAWSQIMDVLDSEDATLDERVALANFINDAWSELGSDSIEVPGPGEVQDMLLQLRATS